MVKGVNIKDRYKIVPQMEFYDKISCEYKPFIMFFNVPNFKSKIVNTDNLGFRLNFYNNEIKKISDFYNKQKVTIVIGGSSVFGFGSSSDQKTISSNLSRKKNNIFINFGATAFNSKQEILLFLNFFQKFNNIEKVIIISGANDLYINLINNNDDEWGNFFFKEKYQKIFEKYKKRNQIILKIKNSYFKIFNKRNYNITKKINFKQLENNYIESFSLWSSISRSFNFKVHFFLQPIASWTRKKLTRDEKDLFYILDNSDDFAHLTLKETSKYENYVKFSTLLKNLADLYQINFIDLNEQINKSNNLNNSFFVDRVHMNDLGYDEISKIILNYI